MMAIVLLGESVTGAAVASGAGVAKISSNSAKRGASGHEPAMASRNAASLQQTRPAAASRIKATRSAGAWRGYSGTALNPSERIARTRATHRKLFGAAR